MVDVASLHEIGAALFVRLILPVGKSPEETARYLALMAGSESDHLDLGRIRQQIESLRASLEGYRSIVERLLSDDEIVRLANRAQEEALGRS